MTLSERLVLLYRKNRRMPEAGLIFDASLRIAELEKEISCLKARLSVWEPANSVVHRIPCENIDQFEIVISK